MEDKTRFLTVPETAKLLRINRGRAYAMANDGTLPGVIRLGRTIRVDRVQLIAGLTGNLHDPTSEVFRSGD
jgi:excisionase family DNA binding protein